ncbi:putative E3 ubiquitin-protein ligase MARCH [Rosa chinensis]|uniref:Putative E3 ubiquitin-protein ligase MARCH n=1 Tax=Rosa chinensis TaxID=74649 RepID=A0A2P6SKY4_ROSCH|nr:uncharacterized protein LOC112182883 [Rosa chinensis]PRQ59331.1 putative E3 ubiquitin-protein ligase MARCH [Rosa chinensis]
MASKTQVVVVDVEQGGRRSSGHGYSDSGSDEEEEEEHRSSCVSGSSEEIVERGSSESESSVEEEVDLECGGVPAEVKVHVAKVKRDCRICHLSMDATNHESGIPIELGCSCKEDLAAAHKQCAEAWFKIKGNKTCEICGSTARNVSGVNEAELAEQWNEANDTAVPPAPVATTQPAENRNFWQGHRFLNFLLACMVFAFVISWLFHFNVPS